MGLTDVLIPIQEFSIRNTARQLQPAAARRNVANATDESPHRDDVPAGLSQDACPNLVHHPHGVDVHPTNAQKLDVNQRPRRYRDRSHYPAEYVRLPATPPCMEEEGDTELTTYPGPLLETAAVHGGVHPDPSQHGGGPTTKQGYQYNRVITDDGSVPPKQQQQRRRSVSSGHSDDGSHGGCCRTACGGPLNVLISQPFLSSLLLFIPLGIISHCLQWRDSITFSLNFIAIVPQAWLMGKATEDLAAHAGQITGGLLNAWFGNVVEMLLCIAGLRAGELLVVKATLVGSILSNLLLVTGCSFLFGGFKHKVQEFSAIGASTNASLMTLSCLCLGLPTMYAAMNSSALESELNISRSVSFFLIFIYVQYLIFQMGTHAFLFEDEEDEEADLSPAWAGAILAICTVICALCSEFLVQSIAGTVDSWNVSKSFIGIILLPIIGNAAEHYTSVIVALRNKMDLSLACAIGSSCQMALFVTPFTVLVGWVLGQPMSLDLRAFEMAVLLMAVLIVTSILQDGYSNWLEGSMLLSAYFVVALIYFFE